MKVYNLPDEDMTTGYNQAKDLLAIQLCKDGLITKEQCDAIQEKYAIICAPQNYFGQVISKLMKQNDVSVVKIVKLI